MAELPEGMLEEHGNVTLTMDLMYINKIPFIITLSRAIAELIVKHRTETVQKIHLENKYDKPMLYIKLKKALYATLQAALLF